MNKIILLLLGTIVIMSDYEIVLQEAVEEARRTASLRMSWTEAYSQAQFRVNRCYNEILVVMALRVQNGTPRLEDGGYYTQPYEEMAKAFGGHDVVGPALKLLKVNYSVEMVAGDPPHGAIVRIGMKQ